MKKVIFSLALLLTCSLLGYAQKGISYQAVILDPNPIEIPGQDLTGQPFVNGAVSLKFKIYSSTFVQEFEEVHTTQTDAYGMVNVLIGSQNPGAFSGLVWDSKQKSLQVLVSFDQGGTYTKVSEQVLTYNPLALYAETAGKLSETLSIAGGGTGATTATGARTNLGLGNVDNTSDANKSISTATKSALDAKVDKVAGKELSTNDYTTAEKTKLAGISGSNTGDQDLSAYATTAAVATTLATKVDKVVGKELSTNDYTTAEKTKLAGITGSNTGDQDLSAYATTTAVATTLATKVDKVAGKELSTNDYTTAEKTKLTGITGINTGDQDLSAYATTTTVATGLATKVDKVAGKELSTNDYTTAEKTKLAGITGINTGDQTTITGNAGTATKLLAPKNINGVAFDGSADITIPSLGTVPYTGATQGVDLGAYDLKANGVTVGRGNGAIETNTALGSAALLSNTTGYNNTAAGYRALYSNTTGDSNTATGLDALGANSTGSNNTATGREALRSNTTGPYNTATGYRALYTNTTGYSNTANGSAALSSNTTGLGNTANGNNSLENNTTGILNTANGNHSLRNNQTGSDNTASGRDALLRNTTGGYNTAIGTAALETNTTGYFNTAIGTGADVISDNLSNTTAIGYNAKALSSNTIQLGNTAVTNVKTSGSLTAGAVTYPNTDGTTNQVLTTNGTGTLSWATPTTTAATLTTSRSIYGNAFDGSAALTGVIASTYGGTGNGFAKFTGPTTSEKTFTLPDASATILTSNATVSVAQGGTGQTTIAGIQSAIGLAGAKVAVGDRAGQTSQSSGSVAIGTAAGQTNQGSQAVAIGYVAGNVNQGANSVAIGSNAAQSGQGIGSIAIGLAAGSVGANAVGLGSNTAASATNAVAIGNYATNSIPNTIQLGADGTLPSGSPVPATTNVKTSGTLTAGTVTYPNSHGSANQVLTTTGSGALTWTTPITALTTTGTGAATLSGTTLNIPTPVSSGSTTYSIGPYPELGGYVFYVTPNGKHGLVAETIDQGSGEAWWMTRYIAQSENHSSDGKNFTDWKVPSIEELRLMYAVRASIGGNFGCSTCYYWSSSDYSGGNNAFRLYPGGGDNADPKTYSAKYRAIRSF